MIYEHRTSFAAPEAATVDDARAALEFCSMSLSGSTEGERPYQAPGANDRFRPDAALLPLLPVEDHFARCDCDACTRRRRNRGHS